ncbi:hypothetical protein R3W88_012267 [Solanum pinnatisectum]|uniref:Uncharacterized protein n=1 Tax=Solanum pinnatisectum TaxID=50273 RepID=A0AAV9L8U6_9SOLN|nr:hypothetical protein R3W88_012267 [Solanum pinnatisectum]
MAAPAEMATGEGGNASTKRTVRIYKKGSKLDEAQIRIYFPKGSGKHKYSFQRVEVPSLPIHFFEEHSVTTYTDKHKSLFLNRIFERENYSQKSPRYFKLSKENLVNQEMGDDDNLILHVLAGANDRTTMVKDSIQEAMTAIQASEDFVDQEMDDDDENLVINVNSLSKESRLATDIQKEGRMMPSNRKRKAPSEVKDGEAHTLLSKAEAKQSLEFKRDSQLLNRGAILPKKSPWKDLVSASSGATFSVLDILPSAIPGKEMQYGSDGVSEFSSDEKDEVTNNEKVSDHLEELAKVESEDAYQAMRKYQISMKSWIKLNLKMKYQMMRKYEISMKSWIKLNMKRKSSFSISQILPDLSLPKPELPVMGEIGTAHKSNSTDKSNSQDFSVEEQNNVHFSKKRPVLDDYQKKETMKNEGSAPTPEKEHVSALKQVLVEDTNYNETCSFMRSAASMKDWMKTKAALYGSLKKKINEKK